jgi:hypothetical protein
MRSLPILWQRLVSDGRTCDRCRSTQAALHDALATLEKALAPLGLRPELESKVLDAKDFAADPLASNRIWIAGRPLEDWLGAGVGTSPCCTVCGDRPCRTLELEGRSCDAVPADAVVKAALLAAARLVLPAQDGPVSPACCSGGGPCQRDSAAASPSR